MSSSLCFEEPVCLGGSGSAEGRGHFKSLPFHTKPINCATVVYNVRLQSPWHTIDLQEILSVFSFKLGLEYLRKLLKSKPLILLTHSFLDPEIWAYLSNFCP